MNLGKQIGWQMGCGATVLALVVSSGLAVADPVVVVSSKNLVKLLSKSEASDIFLGKTNRFPDGTQAIPIDQTEGTAGRDEFYAKFTGKSAAQVKAYWSKIIFTGRGQPPKEVANSNEVKKTIADNPNTIGYIDQSAVDASVRVVSTP
jgi:ABC-type phosphate transport system substrate-binding protein